VHPLFFSPMSSEPAPREPFMMKDSFPDCDPVEEAAAARWYLEEHLERIPRACAASDERPSDVDEAARRPQNRFGHFILLEQIGCGSSGSVFRSWDTRWNQAAAVKLLHAMEPTVLDRFVAEAPRASRLKQASIATPYEAGEHGGQWYVAMTYIDGRPIDAEDRPLTLTLELVRDACRAVDEAHLQGVAHGSLSARNLLVNRLDQVFVTGFGVPNRLVPADVPGDVHDLGIVLRRLIHGHPEVSPELEEVAARAAASTPEARFPSASAMADELDRLLLARRYTGSFGLPRRLARKWGPVAVAGAALAFVAGWIVPAFLSSASGGTESGDLKTRYKEASLALLRIEESDEVADTGLRGRRLREYAQAHLAPLLESNPRSLHARVLKARAMYLESGGDAATRELEGLLEYQELDYRVRYFQVLIELEKSLSKPLPLPAPEAPGPEWNGGVPDWRGYHGDLGAVVRAPVEPDSLLFAEHRRDSEAAQALMLLVEGQWRLASEKLTQLVQTQKLPVYLAARRAAAYLARRFDEVLDEPGTQFALALDSSDSPSDDLKRLQPLFAGDPNREGTLYCWAARRCIAQGVDPRPHVEAAMRRSLDRESRAILQVAHLRWRGDDERYREVAADLGEPSTWMGRIAAIEALIGSGRHLKRRGGDAAACFEEAIRKADELPQCERWNVPRLLRAEALLGLGRCAEARAEAKRVRGAPTDEFRSLLIASAATLRLADLSRRAGSAAESEFLLASIADSERALILFPSHPEAVTLRAAATIFAAERVRDARELERAIGRLTFVLDRAPDHVEARYHRASAHFLLASGRAALEDLDRILEIAPDLSAARALRAAVLASQGRDGACVEDLREALRDEQCPDREELERWLGIIESRK
jgi:tetratricopeptide (TPR) repeat protein/tRNA A-37 threonylcarbamoyl transferase component Bud32